MAHPSTIHEDVLRCLEKDPDLFRGMRNKAAHAGHLSPPEEGYQIHAYLERAGRENDWEIAEHAWEVGKREWKMDKKKQRFKIGDIIINRRYDADFKDQKFRITNVMDNGMPFDYYCVSADQPEGTPAWICFDDHEVEAVDG